MGAAYFLHVDIDPRAGEDVAAEQSRIHQLIDDWPYDIPPPDIVIFSGGGFQLFWTLADKFEIGGSIERCEEFERYNRHIEQLLDADNCHNADRIMRVPGTWNLPNEAKLKKGRTKVEACVLRDTGERHDLSAFPQAPRKDAAPDNVVPLRLGDASPVSQDELDTLPPPLPAMAVNGQRDVDNPVGDRSAVVLDFACNGLRAEADAELLYRCLLDPGLAISAHVRDQKKLELYARRQIERAQARVAEDADEFHTDDKGKPYASQHNIRVALRRLDAALTHDTFADRLLLNGEHLSDAAMQWLYLETERRFKFRPGKDYYWMVVENEARANPVHPVCDYLGSLQWDGKPRVADWLVRYCSAEDTAYVREVGRLFLTAAVRRVRQPGCKFDEMLVLESPQGGYKSTALATLAIEDDWFSDDLPLGADTKTVIERLRGHWIVEAAELKGMRKADIEHLKAFLSRRFDKARMAYGRMVTEAPRQCVIVGTTNSEQYLRDGTGNRRYWPVRVGEIDIVALRGDRDQLWAEAAFLESEGESIRLRPEFWADAQGEQERRRVEDPYTNALADTVGDRVGKIRATDVWKIVGIPVGQRTQDHNARLGDAMRELGWERTKLRFGGPPEWCYAKGQKWQRRTTLYVRFEGDSGERVVVEDESQEGSYDAFRGE